MEAQRPNPDELLSEIQREERKQQRGHLKIFFGACAGVGKTYAMLQSAQRLHAQNMEVVVGLVETHGRVETAELLKGLEILPPKLVNYHDSVMHEFDLDAALARKPSLILVDELAHSNLKGSRHNKRWQDVQELLDMGIDVYTTMNVQHLESLNDIIGQITGIHVLETVPDSVFEQADEVILVDLPPDELLQRLKSGKVYVPQQTQQAIQNFFRKGNLIALRELALRRVANRVDAQMNEYRQDQAIQSVWQAKERVLVCVSPHPSSERLIRKAFLLASTLRADWIAIYVETPALQKLSIKKRDKILKNLKLAQELGAETSVLAGTNIVDVIMSYAHSRNVTKIVVGQKPGSRWLQLWRPPLSRKLVERLVDIDIMIIRCLPAAELMERDAGATVTSLEFEKISPLRLKDYGWGLLICAGITALSFLIVQHVELINVAMLYILGIVFIAVRLGRGPSLLSSFVSAILFQLFSIRSSTQYFITFSVMLVVAGLISNLTANLRYQMRVAMQRERRTKAVYSLSKELSAALTMPQIVEISSHHLAGIFQAKTILLLPDSHDKLHLPIMLDQTALPVDLAVAQWSYDHQSPAGIGTDTLPANPMLYLPLRAPMRTRGVLAVSPKNPQEIFLPEQQRLLDTFVTQIALALERVHYVEVARDALLTMESERLRSYLLNAISHNLRQPLADVLELAYKLTHENLSTTARDSIVNAIYQQTLYVDHLISELK